ncbi:PREDICTED: probable LRR receptor-like serine/threonine-protein kinase At2g16250 [Prunus mume]|uniref:Probable LRR receptor-like serine/threonine-protein kinase At2g16250 n=1 Tax=Prunus mume TaxID=102107 RepID=A0ABM0PAX0_PRUMU|nr:PREDICTED: probable LRR receptor-like serine/threonine-protein kinase At2g16250 [Prunus mume]XP_008236900.1 PREDICTED: probable LRR receptor-like serine/threonine-protein kinase At2g16250 [Prunus mume]XP_008236901.1 PREDICTED: probable LRR receptor-like serine/threonine-protein kinase At2g16250 [Prunus mume]
MVDQRSIVSCALFLVVVLLFEPTFEQQSQPLPLGSTTERVALLELRSSLGLRSRDWPIKADPCIIWRGIYCQNGRVVGINISGFRRTRLGSQNPQFSVDALANFTLLQSFNASNFLLPGSIPDWFGQQVRSLQVLDLTSCSVLGPIPLSLGNSSNLTGLYLSHNNLTGTIPASLSQLSRLSVFNLSRNRLTGSIPTSFGNLRNLSVLDISGNYLSGSIPLGIGTLMKLQYLNLSSNMLTASIPAQLGDLDSLVDLDLSANILVGSVPSDLRGLRNLQRMIVADNLLSGTLPDNLFPTSTQLQVIVLRNNGFTGGLPKVLWSMAGLSLLDVSGNNFTGLLPNSSLNANATAAVFNISQNLFYGSLTPLLGRFSVIDISGNYFQGGVPGYVGTSASLDRNCLRNVKNQKTLAECSSFYNGRGLTFDNFGQPNSTQPPPPAKPPGKSNKKVIILAAVLGGVGLIVLLVLFLVVLLLCLRKRGTTTERGIGVGPITTGSGPPPPGGSINFSSVGDAFTYQQLLQAAGDFSNTNLIKNGHSGDLFRGVLENGIPVVIKRIDLRSMKKEAYIQELEFFNKVSHTRFVPLLGHCLENENEKFLVYKYMPNGDLSSSLYKKTNTVDDSLQSLDWITRLKIALGAAEGLSYLHHECNPPLVHRDVQASSILLDDKFEVRLGSLTDVCSQEGDTHQSRITRLLRLPQSSEQGASGSSTALCAYDVYCFGKVLLELVTGKLGISASSDAEMKELLDQTLPYISIYDKELVTKIVDPSLIVDEDLLEEVWAMAVVARSCLNPKPSRRPLMRYILKALENPLKVVREDSSGSARLRTTSSRGSWNAAVFGSWRSSSEVVVIPGASTTKGEGGSGLKRSGTTGSQGSGPNGGGELSSSRRRHSRDIFPEPSGVQDVERPDQD